MRCDPRRVEQLLSNLLANAIEHGAPKTPITVRVGGDQATFELSVSNRGAPIPSGTKAHLFQPHFRDGQKSTFSSVHGHPIVPEIAKSHHGRVDVASNDDRSGFMFSPPSG